MSRISPLSLLAQLMLKNQHELRETLNQLTSRTDPLNLGLQMGGTSTTLSLSPLPEGALDLSFSQNGHTYRLTLPSRADSQNAAKVSVTLASADGQGATHVFKGEDLFTAKFNGVFAELHEKVLAYLKKALSRERLEALGADAATAAPASEPESMTPAAPADDGFREWRLQRQDKPDLRFKGKVMASAQSPVRQGRQHVYSVLQTPAGKWVAVKQGLTQWLNERNLSEVEVFDKLEDCVPFFGYNWLAKALYAQLGLTEKTEEVIL